MELCGYSVSSKLKAEWKKQFEIAQMEALRKTIWKITMEAYRYPANLCCRWHASWIIDLIKNYPSSVHLRRTTLTTHIHHDTVQCRTRYISNPCVGCNFQLCWILPITLWFHRIEHCTSECDSVHKIFPSTKHDMPPHRNGERSFFSQT